MQWQVELRQLSLTQSRSVATSAQQSIPICWECVVIIYCNIFLPLLLTILSVYLVPLLTLSCVNVPLPLNTGIPGTVPLPLSYDISIRVSQEQSLPLP